jgi:hypothetical protein
MLYSLSIESEDTQKIMNSKMTSSERMQMINILSARIRRATGRIATDEELGMAVGDRAQTQTFAEFLLEMEESEARLAVRQAMLAALS